MASGQTLPPRLALVSESAKPIRFNTAFAYDMFMNNRFDPRSKIDLSDSSTARGLCNEELNIRELLQDCAPEKTSHTSPFTVCRAPFKRTVLNEDRTVIHGREILGIHRPDYFSGIHRVLLYFM